MRSCGFAYTFAVACSGCEAAAEPDSFAFFLEDPFGRLGCLHSEQGIGRTLPRAFSPLFRRGAGT